MSKLYNFLNKNNFFSAKDFGNFYKKHNGLKMYEGKELYVLKYLAGNQLFVQNCCLKEALFGNGLYFDEMCTTCEFVAFVLLKNTFNDGGV